MKLRKGICLAALCIGVLLGADVRAQIPNPGFESWSQGNPVGWLTSNIPSVVTNITQSASAHSGSSAVQGTVVNFSSIAIAPLIASGSDARGFAVSSQQPAVHGWYKYTPVADDFVYATVTMLSGGSPIGSGGIASPDAQSVYQEFVVDISYTSSSNPDTCIIVGAIANTSGTAHIGSTFSLDDLSFGPVSAVDEHGNLLPGEFALLQNYPNPFNPITYIQYAIPQTEHVQLKVFDVLGREVAVLMDQKQNPGSYRAEFNAANLPSGVYYYRLTAGSFLSAKKLMVIK